MTAPGQRDAERPGTERLEFDAFEFQDEPQRTLKEDPSGAHGLDGDDNAANEDLPSRDGDGTDG
jgi:hypothetical protein